MANPYQILGLPVTASAITIRARHRELARVCHPDRAGANQREKFVSQMSAINAARDALITKAGKLTPLAKQLRRENQGTQCHHSKTIVRDRVGRATGSVEVIYAQATNAAMRELLEQIEFGEEINLGSIIGSAVRAAVPKQKRR